MSRKGCHIARIGILIASLISKKRRADRKLAVGLKEGDVILKRKPASNDGPERTGVTAVETMEPTSVAIPDGQEVADRAYQRWVERGCPQGSPEEDWFEAERELRSKDRA